MPSLTLYTRSGCSLCQAMEQQLARLAAEWRFSIETVDLEDHPEFEARYGKWVPTLMASTVELCHYHLNEAGLREWLVRQTPHRS